MSDHDVHREAIQMTVMPREMSASVRTEGGSWITARSFYTRNVATVLGRFSFQEKLYYCAFLVWLIYYVCVSQTNIADNIQSYRDIIQSVVYGIVCVLLLWKCCLQRYSHEQLLGCIGMGAIAACSIVIANDYLIALLLLFIISSRGISFDVITMISIAVLSVAVVAVPALAACGVIESASYTYSQGLAGQFAYYNYGFGHPNYASGLLMAIGCSVVWLSRSSYSYKTLMILVALTVASWAIFGSRTYTMGLLLLGALQTVLLFRGRKAAIKASAVGVIVLMLVLVITVILIIGYSSGIKEIELLNILMSGRIGYMHDMLLYYGITLFGQPFDSLHLTLDNAYVHLILRYGVVPFSVLILCWVKAIRKSDNMGNPLITWLLSIYFVIGIAETGVIQISINPLLIITGSIAMFGSENIK